MKLAALLGARRLSTRIVALSLGLLLLVQAAGFIVTGVTIERSARANLSHELEVFARHVLNSFSESLGRRQNGFVSSLSHAHGVAQGLELQLAKAELFTANLIHPPA